MKIFFSNIEFIFFNFSFVGSRKMEYGISLILTVLAKSAMHFTTFPKNSKVHQDLTNTKLGHQGSIKDCKNNSLSAL